MSASQRSEKRSDAALAPTLATHLERLDRDAAMTLVGQMQANGASVEQIITGHLTPALVEVGRRWSSGAAGSAEAQASAAIVRATIPRAPMAATGSARRPVAVCCPYQETHEIPAEMFTELLLAECWPAQYIGAGLTPAQLPSFFASQRPLALLVSCTTPCGLPGAARIIQAAHGLGVPVMVGGAAFGQDSLLAVRLGAAAWAPTAHRAVSVLEAWNDAPPTVVPARPLTEEYLIFERGSTEITAGALEVLGRATPSDGADPAGMVASHDRLELVLRYLGAALLVDDGRLFHDFLSWRSAYYRSRDISLGRLVGGLTAIAASLPGEAVRARSFVEDGLQHLAWFDMAASHSTSTSGRPVVAPARPPLAKAFEPGASLAVVPLHAAAGPSKEAISPPAPQPAQEQAGRVFADLLFVAAMTCRSPLALISVARPNGGWSTLSHGTERRDLLVDDDLFTAIGEGSAPLEISDLARHPTFRTSALASGPLAIRFVYGIPLRNRQSALLGVFCVLDRRPRELSGRERQAMTAVARQVGSQLVAWRRGGGGQQSGLGEPRGTDAAASPPETRLSSQRDIEPELLRSHEVAVLFDVTERTVINWAAAKRLPAIRTAGGHLRFRADDVLALLAGRGGETRATGS